MRLCCRQSLRSFCSFMRNKARSFLLFTRRGGIGILLEKLVPIRERPEYLFTDRPIADFPYLFSAAMGGRQAGRQEDIQEVIQPLHSRNIERPTVSIAGRCGRPKFICSVAHDAKRRRCTRNLLLVVLLRSTRTPPHALQILYFGKVRIKDEEWCVLRRTLL